MISISIHKDKRGSWLMRVMDAGDNHARCILHGSALTLREAAAWLLRNVNRLAAEVEEQLVELGFLTEAECEAVLAEEAENSSKEPSSTAPPGGAS